MAHWELDSVMPESMPYKAGEALFEILCILNNVRTIMQVLSEHYFERDNLAERNIESIIDDYNQIASLCRIAFEYIDGISKIVESMVELPTAK